MRVLVVSESFLPQVNGVTNSVRRVLEHLQASGHDAMLVAPSGPEEYAGAPVRLVRSVSLPSYREFPIGTAARRTLRHVMWAFDPDVVHLASPAWLGHQAAEAARSRGIPVVAVYQTDLIGFAERYPIPGGVAAMRRLTRRVHDAVERTLVPSSASHDQLSRLGIGRLHRWGRGVDTELFHPGRRTTELREELGADRLVGYVGRLAAEKELDLLRHVAGPARHPARRRRRGAGAAAARGRAAARRVPRACARRGPRGRGGLARRLRAHRTHRDLLPVGAGGARLGRARRRPARRWPGGPRARRASTASSTALVRARSCARTSAACWPTTSCASGSAARPARAWPTRSWTSVNEQLVDHYREVVEAAHVLRSA